MHVSRCIRYWVHIQCCLLWSCLSAPLLADVNLTLDAILTEVKVHHPSVLSAKSEEQAADIDVLAAKRLLLPQLTVVSELQSVQSNTSSKPVTIVKMQQPLWTAGRLSGGIRSAKDRLKSSSVKVTETQYQLMLQAVDAWQTYVVAKEKLAEGAVLSGRLQGFLGMMQRRVAAQVSPRIDLDLVKSRINEHNAEMNQYRLSQERARNRLESLLGMPLADIHFVNGNLKDDFESLILLEKPDAEVLKEASNNFPTVRRANLDVDIINEQYNVKKAALWPSLYVRAEQNLIGREQAKPIFALGLQYDSSFGLSTWSEAKALKSRADAQRYLVENQRRDIAQTIEGDWYDYSVSKSRAPDLAALVANSGTLIDSYERLFVAGKRSWLDVLNLVRELKQNQFTLVDSYATAIAAAYRLRTRMGVFVVPEDVKK